MTDRARSGSRHAAPAAARSPDLTARTPAILLACGLLGFGLYQLLPLAFPNGGACTWIGLVFIGLGILTAALTLREFHRWRTAYVPGRAVTWLIRSGPFRISRNPLYLAMCLAYFGLGMMLNNGWMMLLLIPAMIIITRGVIVPEERFLAGVFGPDYKRYKEQVPRWLIR